MFKVGDIVECVNYDDLDVEYVGSFYPPIGMIGEVTEITSTNVIRVLWQSGVKLSTVLGRNGESGNLIYKRNCELSILGNETLPADKIAFDDLL